MTIPAWKALPKYKREALTALLDRAFEPNRHIFYEDLLNAIMKILRSKK